MAGRLLLIGTPIGNLNDLSSRAIEAIRSCSLLLCEDTRHTRKMLHHIGVTIPTESFHEHNEDEKIDRIVQRIEAGEIIGLVSDAGMPVLSDPGLPLVRRLRTSGIRVEPIPGPFAAAVALAASGLPPLPFTFYGFAPHREGERRELYRAIATLRTTAIVYESPERLIRSLRDAFETLGDVEVTVARELTKLHEEILNGKVSAVLADLEQRESIRGEITIVFAPSDVKKVAVDPSHLREEFSRLREEGMRRTDAARLLGERFGMPKSEVYRLLLGEA